MKKRLPYIMIGALVVGIVGLAIAIGVLVLGGEDSSDDPVSQIPHRPTIPQRPDGLPTAQVQDIISGDTLTLEDGQRVRLIGINAPALDAYQGDEAYAFAQEMLDGKTVGLESGATNMTPDGEALYYVWVDDTLVNYEMVRLGYANRYLESNNRQYDSYIQMAEQESRNASLGIWQQSAAGIQIVQLVTSQEDWSQAYLRLYNPTSEEVDLGGYTLEDSSRLLYTFPEGVLFGSLQSLNIYATCGENTRRHIYICAENQTLWQNADETAYINDPEGLYVHHLNIGD